MKRFYFLRSPFFYMPLVPFFWSTNFVLARELVRHVSVPVMVFGRILFASAGLLLLLGYYERKFLLPRKGEQMLLLIMGLTGVFGFNYLLYTGLRSTTSVNSALINALYPALTVVLTSLVLKEKTGVFQLAGLVFSLGGVFLIGIRGSPAALVAFRFNPGDFLAFFATTGWAIYSVAAKLVMEKLTPLAATAYATFWGFLFTLPLFFRELAEGSPAPLTWQAAAALVYLGLVPSVLAAFLWNRGVREIGPEKTAYFYNLLPVFSALLATGFLKEEICWYHLVGGLMVLGGVFLGVQKSGWKKEAQK